jgi:bacterioferritin-associated ferredoxin
MYVCVCHAVTENEINAEVVLGARSIEELGARCGAGTGCGMCHEKLRALLPIQSIACDTVAVGGRNRATEGH